MSEELPKERNVLGGQLLACSYDPVTGYFRDGCCATRGEEDVFHLVCVRVTAEFLEYSRERGNDLSHRRRISQPLPNWPSGGGSDHRSNEEAPTDGTGVPDIKQVKRTEMPRSMVSGAI